MAQKKTRTQKVMNLELGSIWFEVILKIPEEGTPSFVINERYLITHDSDPEYVYHTQSRKKVHECKYLIDVMDWFTNYIKTGGYLKKEG